MIIIKRRFITKRNSKKNFRKPITYILVIALFLGLTFNILFKINLNNERIVNHLLASGTNNMLGRATDLSELFSINFASSNALMRLGLNSMITFKDTTYIFSDTDFEEETGLRTEYIEDPNPIAIDEPLVYIYNTHQLENYSMANLAPYNIKPNVLMASYILRERLNELGIPAIVETRNITEILRINNWQYRHSYRASRMLVEDILAKNPSIEYIIDLHRDAPAHQMTTTEIEGINHSRILWVVGKKHENAHKNLAITQTLNDLLKKEHPSLSRGIMLKDGPGVNGIYNQDLHPNSVLIELGGQYNTIEEANNTITILAKILFQYIKGAVL